MGLSERFSWTPWGDGSSADGFGNLLDRWDQVILAQEVPEKFGVWLAELLNILEEMQDGTDIRKAAELRCNN